MKLLSLPQPRHGLKNHYFYFEGNCTNTISGSVPWCLSCGCPDISLFIFIHFLLNFNLGKLLTHHHEHNFSWTISPVSICMILSNLICSPRKWLLEVFFPYTRSECVIVALQNCFFFICFIYFCLCYFFRNSLVIFLYHYYSYSFISKKKNMFMDTHMTWSELRHLNAIIIKTSQVLKTFLSVLFGFWKIYYLSLTSQCRRSWYRRFC